MAQVVIFAPPGEDVTAGESALKDAGHDVEVVEATAVNLLHMAVGMMEDSGETPAEEETTEEPAEEEPAEEEPVTEPTEEEPAAEEPPVEESIGELYIDGEKVPAYINDHINFPMLRVINMTAGAKVSFKLNETAFSMWNDGQNRVELSSGDKSMMSRVEVRAGKTSHIILDRATAKHLGLL